MKYFNENKKIPNIKTFAEMIAMHLIALSTCTTKVATYLAAGYKQKKKKDRLVFIMFIYDNKYHSIATWTFFNLLHYT